MWSVAPGRCELVAASYLFASLVSADSRRRLLEEAEGTATHHLLPSVPKALPAHHLFSGDFEIGLLNQYSFLFCCTVLSLYLVSLLG